MNAYELADDVKNISNTIEALEWVQKATPLLRQQADRIAELERLVSDMIYEKSSGVYDRPQIKELSDGEIVRISKTCDLNHVLGLIDFARAILKKASEK